MYVHNILAPDPVHWLPFYSPPRIKWRLWRGLENETVYCTENGHLQLMIHVTISSLTCASFFSCSFSGAGHGDHLFMSWTCMCVGDIVCG